MVAPRATIAEARGDPCPWQAGDSRSGEARPARNRNRGSQHAASVSGKWSSDTTTVWTVVLVRLQTRSHQHPRTVAWLVRTDFIEQKIRERISPGQTLEANEGTHVSILDVTNRGLSLREGPRQSWLPFSWECLELTVDYLSHGRWVRISHGRRHVGNEKHVPTSLGSFLWTKSCLKAAHADCVARILFAAGMADIDSGPPERIRLEPAFLDELRRV